MTDLLAEVLEAHGGEERWRTAREIRAHVRTRGLLLTTRAPRDMYPDYEITIRVGEPWARFEIAGTDEVAGFDRDRVWREGPGGETIEARDDPRSLFFGRPGLRRNLRWDRLDLTYFAGYAMWNYLTSPLLLTRPDVEVGEREPWRSPSGETWRRLDARFAPGLHTHSPGQTFWVGADGLLRRHDYTAEVVGGWAKAAHTLSAHRVFDGLVFPTERRVTPRRANLRALSGPTLVGLSLDRIAVAFGGRQDE